MCPSRLCRVIIMSSVTALRPTVDLLFDLYSTILICIAIVFTIGLAIGLAIRIGIEVYRDCLILSEKNNEQATKWKRS